MGKEGKHKKKPLTKHAILGLILAAVFILSAAVLFVFCVQLGMFPTAYFIIFIIAVLLIAEAIVFANRWRAGGIVANVLSCFLIAACVLGCFYADITQGTVIEVQSDDYSMVYMGVYVMDDDPAEELEDAKGYNFGYDNMFDEYSTQEAITYIEEVLEESLDLSEYENMYEMLDELSDGEVDAVILGESYMAVAEEIEDYEWLSEDVRELARIEIKITEETEEAEAEAEAEEAASTIPETFIVYISGIDSYGEVSVVSRSDVNILAVVNTTTREILLVNTPRDYYVEFEATNGGYDKLTHAGLYGIDQSEDALERLYDIEIDYYLRMNFTGFENIIDALGGVTVYSEYAFTAKSGETYVEGYNTLNGEEALAFARERKAFTDGDIQRGKNQMALIEAIIDELTSFATVANFQAVMNAIGDSFETDMTTDEINSLIKMQLSGGEDWSVETLSVTGDYGYAETYSAPGQLLSVVLPDEEEVENAQEAIEEVLNAGTEEDEEEEEEESESETEEFYYGDEYNEFDFD